MKYILYSECIQRSATQTKDTQHLNPSKLNGGIEQEDRIRTGFLLLYVCGQYAVVTMLL